MSSFVQYIGRSYDHQLYNCWHFFRDIQREFGRDLPEVPILGSDLSAAAKALRQHPLRRDWIPIATPVHGCGVMMGKTLLPTHVGCWLELDGGGVMHNTEQPGVVFVKASMLSVSGWNILGYYHYRGEVYANNY